MGIDSPEGVDVPDETTVVTVGWEVPLGGDVVVGKAVARVVVVVVVVEVVDVVVVVEVEGVTAVTSRWIGDRCP